MKPKSQNLFHFTRSAEFVQGILLNGFWPRYCLEDLSWAGTNLDYMAYPMVCFCDIPISRISDHTAFYGDYGIGLTKEWGLKNKLAPVIYASPSSAATKVLDYLLDLKVEGADKKKRENANFQAMYDLVTLVKPIVGKMYSAGKLVEKEFYQESEWRYVPAGNRLALLKEDFESKKDAENEAAKSHKLAFTPGDVRYVFVKSDSELPGLVDFINTKMGHYPQNDLKILLTRLVSLETISADI